MYISVTARPEAKCIFRFHDKKLHIYIQCISVTARPEAKCIFRFRDKKLHQGQEFHFQGIHTSQGYVIIMTRSHKKALKSILSLLRHRYGETVN